MFGMSYFKGQPTDYIQRFSSGEIRREFDAKEERLRFVVREPFVTRVTSAEIVFGEIGPRPNVGGDFTHAAERRDLQ